MVPSNPQHSVKDVLEVLEEVLEEELVVKSTTPTCQQEQIAGLQSFKGYSDYILVCVSRADNLPSPQWVSAEIHLIAPYKKKAFSSRALKKNNANSIQIDLSFRQGEISLLFCY